MNTNTEGLDWQEYEEVTKYIYENIGAKKVSRSKGTEKTANWEVSLAPRTRWICSRSNSRVRAGV